MSRDGVKNPLFKQMRLHVLEPLNDTYGIDISDDALRKWVRIAE